jgi:DNA-binding SARP family transcriptional activator
MMRVAVVMRRLVQAVWSLAWLAILLVGLPAGLVYFVGWPFPDHRPSPQEWQRWVAQPLTRSAVIGTFAVLIWLLWAMLVYALVREIVTRIRRVATQPAAPTSSAAAGTTEVREPAAPVEPDAEKSSADTAEPPARTDEPATDGHVPAGDPDKPSGRSGVALPDGGWVTHDTATATAAAAALVWLHRRRRYLPRPPTGAARDDPDLAPLAATVAAIQDGLRLRHPGAETAQVDWSGATSAAIGEHAGEPLHPDDLPAGGVGLTGAGADAAARGLLAAVLLAGRHRDRDARLVTTAADLDTLLGPTASDRHRDTPGLTVADSLDDALAHLEQAALERGHPPDTHHTHNPAGGPERAGRPARLPPPLLLVTGSPADPAIARQLAQLLTFTAPLRIAGVLRGDWPPGASWRVDPDGTTHPTGTEGVRLSVLTATATTDLLGLLREARPPRVRPARPSGPPPIADHGGDRGVPAAAGRHPHDAQATTGLPSITDPPAKTPLRLRVLGASAVHHSGGGPLHIRRSAAVQILVVLAVHRDGATTAQLAAALWPGLPPQAAANRLYTPISALRTALHQAAGGDVIVRDGECYRLDAAHIDVDLWRLHTAVNAAAAPDHADRQQALHAVVDTYTGELAAGGHWPWLAPHREAARRHAVDAYAALAALSPDPRAAVALLQHAIRVDPCNEELHRRAMRGYADAGDSAAARQLLASFTGRLAEMGLQPADAIQ